MHTQIKRKGVPSILGMWLVLIGLATTAKAATVFTNNFDSYSTGPLGGPWSLTGTPTVTNNIASSSPNSVLLEGNEGVQVFFAAHTQLWFQVDVHVMNAGSGQATYLKFMDSTWALAPAQLHLRSLGNGTYDVMILDGVALGSSTVYTNLTVETGSAFTRITFGATVTNPVTGDGLFSLYVGANALAVDTPYTTYNTGGYGPAVNMTSLQILNSATAGAYVDNVGIFEANPIPEPSILVLGAAGAMALWCRHLRRT